jgi:hypothetical protein
MLTDRYQVATIPPLFWLPGYLAYRTVGSNLVVSIAWQWLFYTLDNSAFQTTCHSMIDEFLNFIQSLNKVQRLMNTVVPQLKCMTEL